jgi:LuxR family maltose regulon positive regulatory protein
VGDLEKAAGAYAETIRMGRIGRTATAIAVVFLLGRVLWILGRLRETEAACRDAMEYIEEQGMSRLPAVGLIHVALAEVLVERNDLQAAEDRLSRGMELGRRSGRLNAVHNAAHARMRLCLARQDAHGAMAAVQEAISAFDETKRPLWGELLAFKAIILARQGSLTEATASVEEATRLAGEDRGVTGQTVALAAHRVRLAQSKPDEAIAQLTRSLAAAEESGRLGAAIEMRILRSLALARQGDAQKAKADLERALALAEPEGYLRLFLDEGQPIQLLLAQWLAHANAGHVRDYAIRVLSQFDAVSHAAPEQISRTGDLVEPLTPREIQVLRLIYAGDSNQEIAAKLVITTSAVKKHTGNIFGKLGATNRAQAIVKARQMGLFPEDR